jgi:hypothetical protein
MDPKPTAPRKSSRGRRALHAACALTGILTACGGDEARGRLGPHDGRDLPPVDTGRVAVGDFAPDFTVASYDDGVITLSDYRGSKDVVLVFYRGHW